MKFFFVLLGLATGLGAWATDEPNLDLQEFRACEHLQEAREKKACFDELARRRAAPGAQTNTGETVSMGLHALTGTLAAVNYFGKDEGNSSCLSGQIFGVTAAAGVAAEAYFYMWGTSSLDELKESYARESLRRSTYRAQVRAFEQIKAEQEEVARIAGRRKMAYGALALGYGAAAAAAAWELANPFDGESIAGCHSISTPAEETVLLPLLLQWIFPKAWARDASDGRKIAPKDLGLTPRALKAVSKAMEGKVAGPLKELFTQSPPPRGVFWDLFFPRAYAGNVSFDNFGGNVTRGLDEGLNLRNLKHPAVILGVSLLSSAIVGVLSMAASSQQDKAELNASIVDGIIARFRENLANYCATPGHRRGDDCLSCYDHNGRVVLCDRTRAGRDASNDLSWPFANSTPWPRSDRPPAPTVIPRPTIASYPTNLLNGLPITFSDTADGEVSVVNLTGNTNQRTAVHRHRDNLIRALDEKLTQQGQDPIPKGDAMLKEVSQTLNKDPRFVRWARQRENASPNISVSVPPQAQAPRASPAPRAPAQKTLSVAKKQGPSKKKARRPSSYSQQNSPPTAPLPQTLPGLPDLNDGIISGQDEDLFRIISRRYTISGLPKLFDL